MVIKWDSKEILANKEINKQAIFGICACAVVVIAILMVAMYFVGKNTIIKEAVLQEKVSLNKEISALDEKLIDQESEFEMNKEELQSQKDDFAQLAEYLKNKDKLTADLEEAQKKLDDLNSEIGSKQTTLDHLNADIVQAKSAPISIPAGEHTVGDGIPAGRYSVTGSSNFVVWSSSGDLKVNTILGSDMLGVDNYVCNLSTGDQIKASSACQLTPIK